MKILEYIYNASKYIITEQMPEKLKEIIASDKNEYYLIVPNSVSIHRKLFAEIFRKYNVAEIFEISNCFLGTYNVRYMLIHIVKKPVEAFKISVYEEPAHLYRDDIFDPDCGKIRIPDKYREDYLSYLQSLDAWIQRGIQPRDEKYHRYYRELPIKEFNCEIIYSRMYQEYNDETRNLLRDQNTVCLHEVADIIPSHFLNSKEIGRALDIWGGMPSYPYIPEKDSVKYPCTTAQIHKNDIVEFNGKVFLIDKESNFDLFAPPGCNIIRVTNISPEYLFLYLKSKIAWRIRNVIKIPAGEHITATSRDIKEFPIVLPKESCDFYVDKFRKIAAPDERVFEKLAWFQEANSLSLILKNECIDEIIHNNRILLRKHVDNDLKEIRACFSCKAYKATVMLIGSVLEAFLIDWYSEIKNINYFEKDLKVNKRNQELRADLIDYIKLLREELGSEWDAAREKADDIRNTRNLIHIKLCLRREETVDETRCRELIEELQYVIDSRK